MRYSSCKLPFYSKLNPDPFVWINTQPAHTLISPWLHRVKKDDEREKTKRKTAVTKKADGKVKTSTVKKKNENKTAQWHPLLPFLTLTPTKTLPPTVHPICFVLIFDSASPSSFCCPINNHCYIRYDVMLGIYPGSFPGLQTSKSTEIEKHVRKRTSEQSRSRKKKEKERALFAAF